MVLISWDASTVIAQVTSDPIIEWVQFGVTGLVIIGFLTGHIWPKPAVNKLLEDNALLRTQRDELIKLHQAETIPTLAKTNELLGRLTERRRNEDDR